MPAVIFSGSKVKTLKKILSLFGGVEIQSSTVDPTSSAVDAPKGSLLLNESNGLVYKKLDAGSSTNWNLLGSNGINLNLMEMDSSFQPTKITNANAEISIGDWVSYADTASTAPVDMTGGSPNSTITRTTSALNGSGSFLMTINSGASRQGEGISCLVNIPKGYRGQSLSFVFPFNTTGSLVEDDFKIYAYDVTNSTLITPTNFSKILGANGQVSAQFPVATNTAQLRVGIHIARTSTGAATITFDDVSLSPFVTASGLTGSDWINNTDFTYDNIGSISNNNVWTKRVGDTVFIRGYVTSGIVSGSTFAINLPSSLKIDTSKITSVNAIQYLGTIESHSGSGTQRWTTDRLAAAFFDGSNNSKIFASRDTTTTSSGTFSKENGTMFYSNTNISFEFSFPVLGWSSNVSIGESSTFNISSYLANGTRVTGTAPTRLGEYRSYLRNAGASTFTETNGSPAISPSASNGIIIYSGNAYSAADTNNNPTRYDIFVGKNKVIKPVFYSSVGKTGFIDTRPITTPDGVGAAFTAGYLDNYDPVTGIYTIMPLYFSSAVTSHDAGFTSPTSVANECYFDVIVSENALAVSSQQPRSEIYLEGSSGHGSTNTTIRRFTSSIKNTGSAITYSDSATLGSSFTINESGVYSISYVDARDVATSYFGLSLNSSQLTTSILSITASNRLIVNRSPTDALQTVSICTVLNAGDIIRPHTDGTPGGVTNISFRITKVSS